MSRTAIVGGGAVGLASAHYLAESGHEVSIFEESGVASGASYGNAGTFAPYACIPVNNPSVFANLHRYLLSSRSPFRLRMQQLPRMLPWIGRFLQHSTAARSHHTSVELARLLGLANAAYAGIIGRAGADLIAPQECLYLYSSSRAFDAAARDMALRRQLGIPVEILDEAAIRALEPNLSPRFHKGALFTGSWFFRSPYRFLTTLAERLTQSGVEMVRASVQEVRPQEGGVDLVLTDGRSVRFDHVVIAAGAKSRHFALQCGDKVPLDTERGYHLTFPAGAGLLSRPCGWAERGFYMTPMADGLRVAGTVELGGFSPALRTSLLSLLSSSARDAVRGLGGPTTEWLGFRPTLPDGLPVLDRAAASPRVIYAFGHQHLGLTLAGITGQIVASFVNDTPQPISLAPFAANRFASRAT